MMTMMRLKTNPLAEYGVNPRPYSERPDGEPHVYYVKTEQYAGWYTQGVAEPLPEPRTFWTSVLALAARQSMSAAHSLGGSITAGAVGFQGPDLLQLVGLIYSGYPSIVMDSLGPAFTTMRVYLSLNDGAWVLRDKSRVVVDFHNLSKEAQKAWVSGMGLLLKDKTTLDMQATHVTLMAQQALNKETRERILWPRARGGWGTVQDLWNYTPEQKKLLQVICAVAAVGGTVAAEAAAMRHVEVEPRDAEAALKSMQDDRFLAPFLEAV